MSALSRAAESGLAAGVLAPPAARAVFALLEKLCVGTLDVRLPDGTHAHFGGAGAGAAAGSDGARRAQICLHNWNVCAAALQSGDIGFAQSWLAGDWSTPDLVALLEVFIANRDAVESVVYGSGWGRWLHRARQLWNRNSRRGSKKNVHAHYDLGNDFYRLWLDPTMHYSSAWWDGESDRGLTQAQWAKTRRALAECGVSGGDRVLEIGCGWGALAELAARELGAHVTGITLSREQLDWGRQRLASAGLCADLRFQDYREIRDEPFDAVVSIEMFEAVGRAWWPAYFAAVRRSLKADGLACIQTITIRDDLFERYARSSDFIQRYVFPGGLLPSRAEFVRAAGKAGFEVVRELEFGADYARTIAHWRIRFLAEEESIRRLGFDRRFLRIWEFYLAYCEAAFATGNTSVRQFTLRRVP